MKYFNDLVASELPLSLLSQERGLKSFLLSHLVVSFLVAPLAGAWIEIRRARTDITKAFWSLLSQERGLKYAIYHGKRRRLGRSSRRSVD